ncbi:MAG: pilus assembly protein PilM [Elusimicrobia bacterium]|nr:pilus assembly protein PilM [Candidatus Obscuribacterium magneticum]
MDLSQLKNFKFKMPSLKFLRSKETLGIDLGSNSIKIVQLSGRKLVRWAYKELDTKHAAPDADVGERMAATTQILTDLLTKQAKTPKTAAISVSGNSVIVRYVKLPKLPRAELEKTIQFEAEPYIPFPIPEVNMSFHILGDVVEEGQPKMETVLVAAKKELIEQRLGAIAGANLRPVVVDVDAFALENAYNLTHPPQEEPETVLLVHIGASVTTMIVLENGLSRVVRDVFIAGNTINKSLQRIFDCSYDEAETLKKKGQILVTPDEKEATLAQDDQDSLQISNTIVTVLKDLVVEIQRSLDFYLSQHPDRQINRILLCGGSARVTGIDRYFSQELRLTVDVFDPFSGLVGEDLPPPELRSSFVVAMGLATRLEGDSV